MKIRHIIGENGAMSALCNGGACPSAVLTEDGQVYIQGFALGKQERGALAAPQGEDFVRMPLETLRRIARLLPGDA